jgi:hypothetical protein
MKSHTLQQRVDLYAGVFPRRIFLSILEALPQSLETMVNRLAKLVDERSTL